jgi:hypothetical protein
MNDNPVELPTYDVGQWNRLPGVTVPHDSDHHAHLRPAPVVPAAPGSLEPQAAEQAQETPAAVVKPEPVREPVKAPAEDGTFSRAYLAK